LRFRWLLENWKRKNQKSPGTNQIQALSILAGGRKILPEITQLFNSIWNKKEMLEEWKDSIILPISKKGDKTDNVYSNYRGISLFQLRTKLYRTSFCQ